MPEAKNIANIANLCVHTASSIITYVFCKPILFEVFASRLFLGVLASFLCIIPSYCSIKHLLFRSNTFVCYLQICLLTLLSFAICTIFVLLFLKKFHNQR